MSVETTAPSAPDRPAYAGLVLYTQVRTYPTVADQKAVALLAAAGLMVSVLIFLSEPLGTVMSGPGVSRALLAMAALPPLVALLVTAVWHATRCLFLAAPAMPPTLAFYADIARGEREEYLAAMRSLGYGRALRELLTFHHAVALLCVTKFRSVERGITCLRLAFFLWLLLLLHVTLSG